jgi:hypothetical protein
MAINASVTPDSIHIIGSRRLLYRPSTYVQPTAHKADVLALV